MSCVQKITRFFKLRGLGETDCQISFFHGVVMCQFFENPPFHRMLIFKIFNFLFIFSVLLSYYRCKYYRRSARFPFSVSSPMILTGARAVPSGDEFGKTKIYEASATVRERLDPDRRLP